MTVNWMYLSEFWSHKNGSPLYTKLMRRGLIWDYFWVIWTWITPTTARKTPTMLHKISRLDQLELVVLLEVVLAASLSRFTLIQPGLDCKVVQTGINLKLAHLTDYYAVAMQLNNYDDIIIIRWIAAEIIRQIKQKFNPSNLASVIVLPKSYP